MKKYLIFPLVLFLLFSVFPAYALDIDPMRLEYTIAPGKTYSGSFRISNPSNFAVDVFLSTDEYRYIFTEGTIPPEDKRKALPSCKGWFQFGRTKLSLNPGEFADAKFFITVPKNAAREHLCAVIFDEKRTLEKITAKAKAGNVQLHVTPRFSIPVYVSIKNTARAEAAITDVAASSGPNGDSVKIDITLKNTGTIHIRPFGTLVMLNQNSEIVKDLPIGKTLPLFPGYTTQIPVICPNLPAGKYSAVATIEISENTIIQKKTIFVLRNTGEIR